MTRTERRVLPRSLGLSLIISCALTLPETTVQEQGAAWAAAPAATGGPASPFFDEGAARFLAAARAGERPAGSSYRYLAAGTDPAGRPRRFEVGIGDGGAGDGGAAGALDSDGDCRSSPVVPPQAIRTSVWCRSCDEREAEDCAATWAWIAAGDDCDARLGGAEGAATCAPAAFDGGTCVAATAAGVTDSSERGRAGACGEGLLSRREHQVTYTVSGRCGHPCGPRL